MKDNIPNDTASNGQDSLLGNMELLILHKAFCEITDDDKNKGENEHDSRKE